MDDITDRFVRQNYKKQFLWLMHSAIETTRIDWYNIEVFIVSSLQNNWCFDIEQIIFAKEFLDSS